MRKICKRSGRLRRNYILVFALLFFALVDQPARRLSELESYAAAPALTDLTPLGIPDCNRGRFFSEESSGAVKFAPTVFGIAPTLRTYCFAPSALSESRDCGGELCA